MQNLLVTVQGPQRTVDLELAGDIQIGKLVPLLLEICGSTENSISFIDALLYNLYLSTSSAPLSAKLSLQDAGVVDGAVLVLRERTAVSLHQKKQYERPGPKAIQPAANTGGIGVTWDRDGLLS